MSLSSICNIIIIIIIIYSLLTLIREDKNRWPVPVYFAGAIPPRPKTIDEPGELKKTAAGSFSRVLDGPPAGWRVDDGSLAAQGGGVIGGAGASRTSSAAGWNRGPPLCPRGRSSTPWPRRSPGPAWRRRRRRGRTRGRRASGCDPSRAGSRWCCTWTPRTEDWLMEIYLLPQDNPSPRGWTARPLLPLSSGTIKDNNNQNHKHSKNNDDDTQNHHIVSPLLHP